MSFLLRPFKGSRAKFNCNKKIKDSEQLKKFFCRVGPEEWEKLTFDNYMLILSLSSDFLANFSEEQKLAFAKAIDAAFQKSSRCNLGDKATSKLLENCANEHLNRLYLSGNKIASETIATLARVWKTNQLQLEIVNLDDNLITSSDLLLLLRAAEAVEQSRTQKALLILSVTGNVITAEPLREIAEMINSWFHKDFAIDLLGNKISSEELANFDKMINNTSNTVPSSNSSSTVASAPQIEASYSTTNATAKLTKAPTTLSSTPKVDAAFGQPNPINCAITSTPNKISVTIMNKSIDREQQKPLITTIPQYRTKACVAKDSEALENFLRKTDAVQWSDIIQIDASITSLTLLQNFGDCNFDDYDVTQIGLGLKKGNNLRHISFASNRIADKGAQVIVEVWHYHSYTETLNLSNNQIGDDGGDAIIGRVWINKNRIRLINLANNNISDTAVAKKVQQYASDFPQITFDVSNNPIAATATNISRSARQHVPIPTAPRAAPRQNLLDQIRANKQLASNTANSTTTAYTATTPPPTAPRAAPRQNLLNQIQANKNLARTTKSTTTNNSSTQTARERRASNLEMFNSEKSGSKFETNAPEFIKAIQELMDKTCISKYIGKGRDNYGLSHTGYRVIRVLKVNNEDLTDEYEFECKKLAKKWRSQSIELLTIQTTDITRQINEFEPVNNLLNEGYFFHGTKPQLSEIIVSQGFDNRVASPLGLFGAGLYFAENSSKSDEYVVEDEYGFCHMFLCRVILGAPKIQLKGVKYNRPPCVNCCSGICNHARLDSVIGEVKSNNASAYLAKYREYIVYEKRQVLPVFHIVYKRI